MLVGCYTIDLYCENADRPADEMTCRVGWGYNGPPQFTGETEGECIRAARRAGWLITRDRPRKAFCPKCAKTRRGSQRSRS